MTQLAIQILIYTVATLSAYGLGMIHTRKRIVAKSTQLLEKCRVLMETNSKEPTTLRKFIVAARVDASVDAVTFVVGLRRDIPKFDLDEFFMNVPTQPDDSVSSNP